MASDTSDGLKSIVCYDSITTYCDIHLLELFRVLTVRRWSYWHVNVTSQGNVEALETVLVIHIEKRGANGASTYKKYVFW